MSARADRRGDFGQMQAHRPSVAVWQNQGRTLAFVRAEVIPPLLMGFVRRLHAAIFNLCAGVTPPMPMFGRSL